MTPKARRGGLEHCSCTAAAQLRPQKLPVTVGQRIEVDVTAAYAQTKFGSILPSLTTERRGRSFIVSYELEGRVCDRASASMSE